MCAIWLKGDLGWSSFVEFTVQLTYLESETIKCLKKYLFTCIRYSLKPSIPDNLGTAGLENIIMIPLGFRN